MCRWKGRNTARLPAIRRLGGVGRRRAAGPGAPSAPFLLRLFLGALGGSGELGGVWGGGRLALGERSLSSLRLASLVWCGYRSVRERGSPPLSSFCEGSRWAASTGGSDALVFFSCAIAGHGPIPPHGGTGTGICRFSGCSMPFCAVFPRFRGGAGWSGWGGIPHKHVSPRCMGFLEPA